MPHWAKRARLVSAFLASAAFHCSIILVVTSLVRGIKAISKGSGFMMTIEFEMCVSMSILRPSLSTLCVNVKAQQTLPQATNNSSSVKSCPRQVRRPQPKEVIFLIVG